MLLEFGGFGFEFGTLLELMSTNVHLYLMVTHHP